MKYNCCVQKQIDSIIWQNKAKGWRLKKVK